MIGDEKFIKTIYLDISDNELAETLKEYSRNRDGEIAALTYAASIRIAILAARVKQLESAESWRLSPESDESVDWSKFSKNIKQRKISWE